MWFRLRRGCVFATPDSQAPPCWRCCSSSVPALSIAFTLGVVRAVASEDPVGVPAAQHAEVDTVVYVSNGLAGVLARLRGDESRVLARAPMRAPRRPCGRPSSPSRISASSSTMVSTCVASGARVWQDVRTRGSSRVARRITQQFVKNACIRRRAQARRARSRGRPRVAARAALVEGRILPAYLNTIYFGNGAYGIQRAASDVLQEERQEADAVATGAPGGPPRGSDARRPCHRARAARSSRPAASRALAMLDARQDLRLAQIGPADRRRFPMPRTPAPGNTQGPAPHFVNYVKDTSCRRTEPACVFG